MTAKITRSNTFGLWKVNARFEPAWLAEVRKASRRPRAAVDETASLFEAAG